LLDYGKSEIAAGFFLLLGFVFLAYLSISIGGFAPGGPARYRIVARFSNVGDLKLRAPVKLAGVTVGEVKAIRLADYVAEIGMDVDKSVALPKDTIASITTAGLLGEAYVALSPGGAEQNLRAGDRITQTEPALNIADLLGRYAFGGAQPGRAAAAPDAGAAPAAPDPAPPPPHHKERSR
jgi:phospholipid/cholesterol/gamma-HCH transport system substrate-binding protein